MICNTDRQPGHKRKRISFLFLGSTGAGPVYSLEMAKALYETKQYEIQIIISQRTYNIGLWEEQFSYKEHVKLEIVDTYKHNSTSFAFSLLEFWKVNRIVKKVKRNNSESLYIPFPSPWDFLLIPKLHKHLKIITTLHDPHPHDAVSNPFIKFLQYKNREAFKLAEDIVILNNIDLDYVKNEFGKRVTVIPHASFNHYVKGIDDSKTLKHTIGFLGRIEPYKGLDLLVETLGKIKDERLHLIIAGSGDIEQNLLQQITKNKRIQLINRHIPDDEFSELIGKMDFVVLPYKRASQSGVIPLVFAHGKAVIVTNVGALAEQVPEGTGIVTNPTTDDLSVAITSLYGHPEKIYEYGKNAYTFANSVLTWAHSAELLMKIL